MAKTNRKKRPFILQKHLLYMKSMFSLEILLMCFSLLLKTRHMREINGKEKVESMQCVWGLLNDVHHLQGNVLPGTVISLLSISIVA